VHSTCDTRPHAFWENRHRPLVEFRRDADLYIEARELFVRQDLRDAEQPPTSPVESRRRRAPAVWVLEVPLERQRLVIVEGRLVVGAREYAQVFPRGIAAAAAAARDSTGMQARRKARAALDLAVVLAQAPRRVDRVADVRLIIDVVVKNVTAVSRHIEMKSRLRPKPLS